MVSQPRATVFSYTQPNRVFVSPTSPTNQIALVGWLKSTPSGRSQFRLNELHLADETRGAQVQELVKVDVVYTGDDETLNIFTLRFKLPWREARRRGIRPLDDGGGIMRRNSIGGAEMVP